MGKKRVTATAISEVATCPRRVYLRGRLGNKTTKQAEQAKARGNAIHEEAFRQGTNAFKPATAGERSGCFIATEVYGEQAWQTETLRNFRDRQLLPTLPGRCFVSVYYALSPRLIPLLRRWNWTRACARSLLDGLVRRVPALDEDSKR